MVPVTLLTMAVIAVIPPVPYAGTHFTDESAIQTVVEQLVKPNWTKGVRSVVPKFKPKTVTSALPEVGALGGVATVIVGES
jgi:hypothetical protein